MLLARLEPTGPGHSLYCLFRGSKHGHHDGCPSAPQSWRPPEALARALDALKGSGAVERVGAYLWLRPGRAAGNLEPRCRVAQSGSASGSYPEGRRFKSGPCYQNPTA